MHIEIKITHIALILYGVMGGLMLLLAMPALAIPQNVTISNNQVVTGTPANTVIGTLSSRDPVTSNHSYSLYAGTNDQNNAEFRIEGSNLITNNALNYSTQQNANVFVTGAEVRANGFTTPGYVGTPDGAITYVKEGDTFIVFTSNGEDQAMYRYTTKDFVTYSSAQKVFEGSGVAANFDGEYAGPGTVIKLTNGAYELYYHAEKHVCGLKKPITFSIGKAISVDKGMTWKRQTKPVVTGRDTAGTCESMESTNRLGQGAGYPSVTYFNGYYYMYYTDWKGSGAFEWPQTHVARARLNAATGGPGVFYKYGPAGYNSPAIGGVSQAVLAESGEPYYYAQGASVTYNPHIKKFVAIYQTNMGFFTRTSSSSLAGNKGVIWESQEQILDFPDPSNLVQTGSTWFSYPTLISPDKASSMETSNTGKFIYAATYDFPDLAVSGVGQYHEAYERPFAIKNKLRKNIRLYSTDNQGGFFQDTFNIYVIPANKKPTNILVRSSNTADITARTWTLFNENAPVGTLVGNLVATDPEKDFIFYSECHDTLDNRFFKIVGNQIYTSDTFDYEVPRNASTVYRNNYSVCVRATDTSGNFFDWHIYVLVADVANQ